MNKIDKQFKKQYPHIYQLFGVVKAHKFGDYYKLKETVLRLYRCDVLELTPEQSKELMFRIHYASPRKTETRKWHK